MAVLTDLPSLKRAFYRLTGTASSDGALTEHDDSTDEAVEQLLQYGAWDAQHFLLDCGLNDRWVSQSSSLSFSGSDSSDGGRYTDLPSDFLRLAGDHVTSALRRPNGNRWGSLIDFEDRFRVRGNGYWLQNEKLWIARNASPPSDLLMDYHHRLATLDNTEVDFPTADRGLIVGFAAERGMAESWLPGGQEMASKIARFVARQKQQAWKRARRSSGPRRMQPQRTIGSHWIAGYRH